MQAGPGTLCRVGLGTTHPPRVAQERCTMRPTSEIRRDLLAFGPVEETNVARFDALIAEAYRAEDEALIPVLLGLLDDDCEFHEVIFGVVHAVESFASDRYFAALAQNLATLRQRAPEWCALLHTRILNSPPHFAGLLDAFVPLQAAARAQEIAILDEIAADPDYAERCRAGMERLRGMPPAASTA
ncbi:Imm30 family immunity protein [Lysobacter sp. Hz 25]|uniref:Imm30 family immunity protein n=1 Tax=Lysobacter sp. Hz 25 TaxID=3383698 RepID=UPI0038D4B4C9